MIRLVIINHPCYWKPTRDRAKLHSQLYIVKEPQNSLFGGWSKLGGENDKHSQVLKFIQKYCPMIFQRSFKNKLRRLEPFNIDIKSHAISEHAYFSNIYWK